MNKKIFLIILAVIIATGAGVWFYLNQKPADTGYQPEQIDINPEELLVFEIKKEKLSEYQKKQSFNRFTTAQNIINKNKQDGLELESDANFYAWLEIASVQKHIGDLESAIQILTWHTESYPGNSVSPGNLGEIYKSFQVDPAKSEYYYKMALERENHDFQLFLGLHDLYRYRLEDEDKAIQVLKDGMELNPNNRNFVTELANYLIVLNRKNEAEKILDGWIIKHPEDFALKNKLAE